MDADGVSQQHDHHGQGNLEENRTDPPHFVNRLVCKRVLQSYLAIVQVVSVLSDDNRDERLAS